MPPFAFQDSPTMGYDESTFVDVPLIFTKQNDVTMNSKSIAGGATDAISVTDESERSSFFERIFDLNLCYCSFNSNSNSNSDSSLLPNTNNSTTSDDNLEETKEDISEHSNAAARNNNVEELVLVQQQTVKEIRRDILMKKKTAEEADRRLEAAERSSASAAFVVRANSSDDITVPFKNGEEKKKPSSMNKHTNNSLRKVNTGLNTNKKKSILMNRVKNSVTIKKGNQSSSVPETKKKRMPTKHSNKKLPSVRKPDTRGKSKEPGMMKRITKSMSLKKFKKTKAEREMHVDKKNKSSMSLSSKKVKKNRATNDVFNDEKKKSSMINRVKKSISLKKVKSKRTYSDLSSEQKKKRSLKQAKINKKMQGVDRATSSSSEKKTNMNFEATS
jgi:hypothetical protein